jgi:hypothetical protein
MAHRVEEFWACDVCGRRHAKKPDADHRHLVKMRIAVTGLDDSNNGEGIYLANEITLMVCQRLSCLLRAAVLQLSDKFGKPGAESEEV